MNYLILTNPDIDEAWAFSAALWELASPADVQAAEGRRSTNWTAPIQHPTQNKTALPLPEGTDYIHPSANPAVLSAWMQGSLTSIEQSAASSKIASKRGGRMKFSDILTAAPSLAVKIKTRTELELAGWFPTEEV